FFERFLQFRREDTPSQRFQRLLTGRESFHWATRDVVLLFAWPLSLPADDRFPSLALPPVREREEMFRALKDWLCSYSGRRPVLFIIEDLHWADASTLEFLGQFLGEVRRDRILAVLTSRPEFHTPWPMLPHQTSLALNRLTKRQVNELMQKTTGRQLPELVIEKIYGRSEGIPLFVEEFTKVVQDSGMLDQASESGTRIKALMSREIPATLQDLVMSRLDRMDGDREMAQLAATIGREFTCELLSAIAGVDEETVNAELAKLMRAEILYQKGRPPQSSYIFKHSLLEDALYNSLVKNKRRQFHGQIAEPLEARCPQTVATQPELIAHHLSEAGFTERSIRYWCSAGLRSQEQFANVEAIGHFSKGLELLNTLPEASERDVDEL